MRYEFEIIVEINQKIYMEVEEADGEIEKSFEIVSKLVPNEAYYHLICEVDPKQTPNVSTHTCFGCKETTLKYDWGPGWIHCPKCGRQKLKEDP